MKKIIIAVLLVACGSDYDPRAACEVESALRCNGLLSLERCQGGYWLEIDWCHPHFCSEDYCAGGEEACCLP